MIKAEIIADSLNSKSCRLTTFILEYPRFCHSEFMTHRMLSKNAASSRAIPIEKMIQQVMDNPAMPVWWGKNQSGMQAKEELDNSIEKLRIWGALADPTTNDGEYVATLSAPYGDLDYAKRLWIEARDAAIEYVKQLNKIDLHKQITNRLLEPWFNIRIIASGTEFENFFALRAHPDAQPEIQALAYKMLEVYNNSEPKRLKAGEWHIPFGDKIDKERLKNLASYKKEKALFDEKGVPMPPATNEALALSNIACKVAVARCARISYLNYEGKDDYEADVKLCDRLFGSVPRHLSPAEHVAEALDSDSYIGNFRGFKQYRKFFEDENAKDSRVKKVFA